MVQCGLGDAVVAVRCSGGRSVAVVSVLLQFWPWWCSGVAEIAAGCCCQYTYCCGVLLSVYILLLSTVAGCCCQYTVYLSVYIIVSQCSNNNKEYLFTVVYLQYLFVLHTVRVDPAHAPEYPLCTTHLCMCTQPMPLNIRYSQYTHTQYDKCN